MELTPVKKSMADMEGQVRLSKEQIKLGNIITDTVRAGSVVQRAAFSGALGLDQDKVTVVAARVGGRIERLYHKSIGEQVRKGEPLFDIYSETMNLSKQEYRTAAQAAVGNSTDTLVLHAAAERLKPGACRTRRSHRWHCCIHPGEHHHPFPSSGIITALDVLGGQVMDGGAVVEIVDLSSLWVEADVLWNGPVNTMDIRGGGHLARPVGLFFPRADRTGATGSGHGVAPFTRIRLRVPNPRVIPMPGLPATVHLLGSKN
ncbi:MAG: efflux RND transporter periplasmic adaptor subunit [Flavobacteriales bacterium]|nr:efflux RND transporter periplasmic adaptor subunit [Flavobacteriales bacterium]